MELAKFLCSLQALIISSEQAPQPCWSPLIHRRVQHFAGVLRWGTDLGPVDILNFKAVCRSLALKIGASSVNLPHTTPLDSRAGGNDGLVIRNVNTT